MTIDPLTGFALKLLGAGLQRGVSVLIPKVMRIRKIDAALKGEIESPSVKAALSDFRIVIGTVYGDLTESLSSFLLELEKSGVADAMVESALLQKPSPSTMALFAEIHGRFFNKDQGDPTILYNQLHVTFSTTLRELCKDKILLEFLQSFHRQMAARLDQIEDSIGQALDPATESPRYDDLIPILKQIARGLTQSFKNIRVETKDGARNVDITKIYIPSKLRFRNTPRNAKKIEGAIKSIGPLADKLAVNPQAPHAPRRVSDTIRTIPFVEIRGSFRRIVVLGDPGGGKSTMCQRLCYDLAKNTSFALQHGERKEIPTQEQKFPIRVILRAFEQARATEPQLDIMTYICRDLQNLISADLEPTRNAITYLFTTGRAFFAFDGLDEILDTSKRRDFVDLVSAFSNKFPLCPVLITSRLVGYDYAPAPSDYEELVLAKFDEAEVSEYVNKFFQEIGECTAAEAAAESKRFIKQTVNNAADLRTNPLMLGLMSWLFLCHGNVPTNRPEIYRDCAMLMFERWDRDRGIKADIPKGFDRLQLFSRIAADIFPNPKLRAGVTREWLHGALRDYFRNSYESEAKSQEAALSLVEFLVGRAWVMSEIGEGIFAFTHQTFLEYFYARHLDGQTDATAELIKGLKARIYAKEWDEVTHLALQLKTYRNDRKQVEALDVLLGYLRAAKSMKTRAAINTFIAKSVEYLAPSETAARRLAEAVCEQSLAQAASIADTGLADIATIVVSTSDHQDFIESCVLDILEESFRGPDEARQRIVASHIAATRLFREDWAHPSVKSLLPDATRDKILRRLGEDFLESSSDSLTAALLLFSCFGKLSRQSLLKFGLDPFVYACISENLDGYDGLTNLALSPAYLLGFTSHRITLNDVRASFVVICDYMLSGSVLPPSECDFARSNFAVPLNIWQSVAQRTEDEEHLIGVLLVIFLQLRRLSGRRTPNPLYGRDAIAARKLIKKVKSLSASALILKWPGLANLQDDLVKLLEAQRTLAERSEAARAKPIR